MKSKSRIFNILYIVGILLIFSPSFNLFFKISFLNQSTFILSFGGKLIVAITLFLEYNSSDKNEKVTKNWWMDILAYYLLILAVKAWIPKYQYDFILDILIVILFVFFFYQRWRKLDKESKTWNV